MSVLTSLAPVGVIAFALNLLLHLTILCLIVLCASRWIFRRDPAARHTLCLTGLICLLLAPAAVGLEAKAGFGLITVALPSTAPAAPVATKGHLVLVPVEKPYRVAISAELPTEPLTAWRGWAVLAAYLLGVSCGALRFAHGCRTAIRLKRDVSPWRAPSDSAAVRTVEQALRAPLPPVFTSPHVASPIAIGLLHPAVILPDGLAETLSPQQLRHVLLHECAHVAFRHGLGGLLERITGVLFWPHPLVRALCRELARAREEVCDNFASQEDGAPCYARTLLLVAQGIDIAPNLASTLALLGTGTSLEARISGLLDPRRNRMVSIKRWKLWAVTGTAVVAMGCTAAIRVVAAQEKAGQTSGGVLPGENDVTRIFAFQFMDADQAAEILYSSLSEQQLQQIDLAVDSRTNSIIVQSSGKQMIAIAAMFKRLEEQAALERAQQEQASRAADAANIAKRQAEAEAQQARAQQATAQARTTFTTQNRVQSNSAPTPQTSVQTRSASVAKSAPVPAGLIHTTAQKVVAIAKQRRLDMEIQITAKRADALSAAQKAKVKASASGSVPPGAAVRIDAVLQSASKDADVKRSQAYDLHLHVPVIVNDGANSSQSKSPTTQHVTVDFTAANGKTTWKVGPVQKIQLNTITSGTRISIQKSLPKLTVPNGKSTQQPVRWVYKISQSTSSIVPPLYKVLLPTTYKAILKSADSEGVKKLLNQNLAPTQTPSQHTTGAPSKTSATITKQQIEKDLGDEIGVEQLKLRGATVQLDRTATDKVLFEKLMTVSKKTLGSKAAEERVRLDAARPEFQQADALDQTKTLKAELDRLTALQMIKEADEKRVELTAAQALEEAARRQIEKNPK